MRITTNTNAYITQSDYADLHSGEKREELNLGKIEERDCGQPQPMLEDENEDVMKP